MVLDLNKNFGRATDLVKKRHRLVDLHTPFHPPPYWTSTIALILINCKFKDLIPVAQSINQQSKQTRPIFLQNRPHTLVQ